MGSAVSFIVPLMLVAGYLSAGFSQEVQQVKLEKSDGAKHAITIDALGITVLSLGGSYEYLAGSRHGVVLEGGYMSSGFGIGCHYRYHYFPEKKHKNFNSFFWGPFVNYQEYSTTIKVKENSKTEEYDLDCTFLKAGVNWGRRWLWQSGVTVVSRIGYGVPLKADVTWVNDRPHDWKTIEAFTRVFNGIDAEFSVGYAF